ncbi:MAG TPA: hypothetical protein VND23_01885 [Acidimicrobiales bacterium]|nr:hypothetical protein [Acidimicrobiales bacterium]
MTSHIDHMNLLATARLGDGVGGGEGLAMHVAADGSRTLFVASEHAPCDFVAVDVSDPRAPSVVFRQDLPGAGIRSNNLAIHDDLLAVTRQVSQKGAPPGGVELFDISQPAAPRPIGHFDASGGESLGTHFVWLGGDGYAYLASGASDFTPRDARDRFMFRILDVSSPTRPVEAGRWWLPGVAVSDVEAAPERPSERLAAAHGAEITAEQRAARRFESGGSCSWDFGFRVHNVTVLPERPDRAYLAHTSAGAYIFDISDRSRPHPVGHLDYATPLPGAAHTFVPLGASGFGLLSDETLEEGAADYPQNVWVVDARLESRPVIVGSLELPWPSDVPATGRFGAHNLHEYPPGQGALRSFGLAAAAMFGLGVAVFDVGDPLRARAVAHFSPGPEDDGPGTGQLNDVFLDDRGVLYALDRRSDYCFVLELDL